MKKWTLILFVVFWLLLMLAFSGGYDSHKTAVAWHHHHGESPSETTLNELQAAKASDRWHIFAYEMILGTVIIWPVIQLVRLNERES